MVDTVYTIGYAGFPIEGFVQMLRAREIALVVDVRSVPYSPYFTAYNKESLALALKQAGIHYRHYGAAFGARVEDRALYTPQGYPDFERVAASPLFAEAVNKLRAGMEKGYSFALLCAEKDPIRCHRAILVARAFADAGYKVLHLLPGQKTMTQQELEQRLLEQYFPNRGQLSLLEEVPEERELIHEAYRKQNAAIGYRSGGEEGGVE